MCQLARCGQYIARKLKIGKNPLRSDTLTSQADESVHNGGFGFVVFAKVLCVLASVSFSHD